MGSPTPESRRGLCHAIATVLLAAVSAGVPKDARVAEQAEPVVQEQDVRSLEEQAPVKQWKPGDPVRVVPDMRTDETPAEPETEATQRTPAPVVHERVTPKVAEGSVRDLNKIDSYEEGDPVRVVPDLKTSDPPK